MRAGRKTRGIGDAYSPGRRLMIFRQFLAPKTGCASYLFG